LGSGKKETLSGKVDQLVELGVERGETGRATHFQKKGNQKKEAPAQRALGTASLQGDWGGKENFTKRRGLKKNRSFVLFLKKPGNQGRGTVCPRLEKRRKKGGGKGKRWHGEAL